MDHRLVKLVFPFKKRVKTANTAAHKHGLFGFRKWWFTHINTEVSYSTNFNKFANIIQSSCYRQSIWSKSNRFFYFLCGLFWFYSVFCLEVWRMDSVCIATESIFVNGYHVVSVLPNIQMLGECRRECTPKLCELIWFKCQQLRMFWVKSHHSIHLILPENQWNYAVTVMRCYGRSDTKWKCQKRADSVCWPNATTESKWNDFQNDFNLRQ